MPLFPTDLKGITNELFLLGVLAAMWCGAVLAWRAFCYVTTPSSARDFMRQATDTPLRRFNDKVLQLTGIALLSVAVVGKLITMFR